MAGNGVHKNGKGHKKTLGGETSDREIVGKGRVHTNTVGGERRVGEGKRTHWGRERESGHAKTGERRVGDIPRRGNGEESGGHTKIGEW